jgi:hypothetical protein
MTKTNQLTIPTTAVMLLAISSLATAGTFNFNTDPFQGTTVRNSPGRQVVGGELFLSFNTASDVFAFDEAAFAMGNQVHFANAHTNAIPSTGVNVVVLEDLDNDANPLTPFGAANAADLIASRITVTGPGVFVYFNESLNLPRLVYSSDLSSNNADLRILARMLNLMGQQGINALPTFSASDFAITRAQGSPVPEPSGMALMCAGIALLAIPAARRLAHRHGPATAAILFVAAAAHAAEVPCTNIIDTAAGFTTFGIMPAIADSGAVAFTATGKGYETGAVFRWQDGRLTVIASKESGLTAFGDAVVLNSEGVVGFGGKTVAGTDSIIGVGDGGPVRVIASAVGNGLVGGPFLGVGGINESGHVVFLAFRKGFRSQAVFQGQGGPLTPLVDTATNAAFTGFGNAAINASGLVVFVGFTDAAEGIFTISRGRTTSVVTTEPGLNTFLDPVINNSGTVASGVASGAGLEVFTAKGNQLAIVTKATSSFSIVDNVSINDSGDVAFFANETNGRDGIFIKRKRDRNPVPLIETGDALFGSHVSRLSIGRYSLNNEGLVVFLYGLTDGRSGLAITSVLPGRDM